MTTEPSSVMTALRKGISQAACEFFPAEDKDKRMNEICALTARFAESAN